MKKGLAGVLCGLGMIMSTALTAQEAGVSPLLSNACYSLWGWCEDLRPGMGVDFKWTHLSGKRDWKREFPKYYPMGNAYFIARFHKYFSLELGYEHSARRSKGHAFTQGEQFFGYDLSGFAYQRTVKVSLPHADLNYLLPVIDRLTLLASLGVGDMSVKTQQVLVQSSNSAVASAILNMQFRHTAVFRARLGLQWLFTPNFGMRVLAGFDNSGHTHAAGKDIETFFRNNQIPYRPLKEAVSGSIGFFVQCGA